jgi:hypothetical protein
MRVIDVCGSTTRNARGPGAASRSPFGRRRGSVLLEFALIALLLYFILAATLEFGRALFGAQVVQQAADVAARELSRISLPPSMTFDRALQQPEVLQKIYDPHKLVIQKSDLNGMTLDEFFATLPIVNQHLRTLMVFTSSAAGGDWTFHYPGAMQTDGSVLIPVVTYDASGAETIVNFVPVIEEIKTANGTGPFSVLSTSPLGGGLVALRLNYPFQAAMLSAAAPSSTFNKMGDEIHSTYIVAPPLDGIASAGPDQPVTGDPGPYSGADGLGQQLAIARTVRPFRRLFAAQAFYRREVFGPGQ